MNHLHVDCFSGISGDMLLGALVDAGLSMTALRRGLKKIKVDGYRLSEKKVLRGSLQATKVSVHVQDGFSKPLSLQTIRRILTSSSLSATVKSRSLNVFHRLAEAEGTVHGVQPPRVHFHEVGVVDSLVDIVGTLLGCEALGIETVSASPINLGSGLVNTAHGTLPVPAPAVACLVKNMPVYSAGPAHELTTPTGAAILTTLTSDIGQLPLISPTQTGYGAGTSDPKGWANVLRIFLAPSSSTNKKDLEPIVELQTNLDDLVPQLYESIMERLFSAGALDVTLTPVIMKRGRPGTILTALANPGMVESALRVIFQETTTLGVRVQEMTRRVLPRSTRTIKTPQGTIRVKVAELDGKKIKAKPEFKDCQLIARKTGQPVREVMDQALMAFTGQKKPVSRKNA